MKIAKKLLDMAPYDAVSARASVALDANESPFDLPPALKEKMLSAVAAVPVNRYPDPTARGVCAAAAALFGVQPEMVSAGNGSDELISLIVSAMLARGDKLLVLEPDFSMYRFYAEIGELAVVSGAKDDMGSISPEDIITALKREKPQMLIFSNPCNPTGQGITAKDMERIIESAPNCLIVVDEAYMDFWSESIIGTAVKTQNVIILRTCSKAFGMAGIRLGFAIANPYLISLVNRARSPYNINALTQAVGEVLLNEKEYLKKLTRDIIASKNALEAALTKLAEEHKGRLALIPTDTNFCLLKTKDAERIYKALAGAGIAIRIFRPSGMLRITAGTPEENKRLVAALSAVLATEEEQP